MGSDNLIRLFYYNQGIVGRLILGQITGLYKMLEYFPQTVDFIGFSSISNLLADVLNFDYSERAARITMVLFNPSGVARGTAGVINSLFVAEAWANWGLLGVLFSPIWVGFVVETIYIIFLKCKKTPLLVGAFTFLSLKWPITGGVNEFIYYPMLLVLFAYLLFFVFSGKFLKETFRASKRKKQITDPASEKLQS